MIFGEVDCLWGLVRVVSMEKEASRRLASFGSSPRWCMYLSMTREVEEEKGREIQGGGKKQGL